MQAQRPLTKYEVGYYSLDLYGGSQTHYIVTTSSEPDKIQQLASSNIDSENSA